MVNYIELLDKLKSNGAIAPLDFHLACFLTRQSNLVEPVAQARFALLIAWLSIEVRSGHVCINLSEITKTNLEYRFGRELTNYLFNALNYPTNEDWFMLCRELGESMVGAGDVLSPFVLHTNRLYFQRMWQYEKHVAGYFNHRLQLEVPNSMAKTWLSQLFPDDSDNEIDWQKVATASAIIHPVTIVSGGPGTGKTTTISKILVMLTALHQEQSLQPLRIIAAAPTGKAAARLTESLSKALATLDVPQTIKKCIPVEAVTLHRLLGATISSNKYLYNQDNPLSVDILLIDEASMIDLPMMSSVIAALPETSRLILLGDKEQLSSVEAGAVFGDLCEQLNHGYSHQHVQLITQLTGYHLIAKNTQLTTADSICLLQKSYRFSHQSGIGLLSSFVKEGQNQNALQLLLHQEFNDIAFYMMESGEEYRYAVEQCADAYQAYLNIIMMNPYDVMAVLEAFAQFRLLCALRDGPFGVKGLNKVIENRLKQYGHITIAKQDAWYIGRPIMILKNSFSLGLFNGDIGITLPAADDSNKLKVYFLLPNGQIKGVSPFRLPEHETAYAMTIHKSQGSEFQRIAIILPNEYTPLLSRSLLYTAITRSKEHVAIYSSKNIIEKTINTQINRQSGLADLLI
ncbi:exodeoxyribonuclease V subunit alpha [Orbus mooreae]|uniref:exodeoxyribonuclease V subunit alpha n=1 Tax=Orbus mooreae TaxID=3074107 RepID=UPI00370D92BA